MSFFPRSGIFIGEWASAVTIFFVRAVTTIETAIIDSATGADAGHIEILRDSMERLRHLFAANDG